VHGMVVVILCQGIVQYSISVLDTSHDNHISATEITDEPDNDLMHNRVDTEAGDIAAGILQRNSLTVEVLSVNGTSVARSSGADGKLMINNVRLWWPYNMNNRSSPYLYTLQVNAALLGRIKADLSGQLASFSALTLMVGSSDLQKSSPK